MFISVIKSILYFMGFPVLANLYFNSLGFNDSFSKIKATPAETIGALMLVPLFEAKPPPKTGTSTFCPGENKSTNLFTFAKLAIASCLSVEETLVAFEAQEGDFKLLVPSLPVAAATKIPCPTAVFAKPATIFASQKPL